MKRVGLIGGIGPASTLDYYMGIINGYRRKATDGNYPEIIIYSIDMTGMLACIENDRWDEVTDQFDYAIKRLAAAGADFAAIASNTPHLVADAVRERSPIPLVSIVEETCRFIEEAQHQRVLMIGTLFTMRNGLYTAPLQKQAVSALLPSAEEQEEIHALFFPNLENGIVIEEDKAKILDLVGRILKEQNADALLLGCTELPLMIKPGDLDTTLIDTTQIHIEAIVDNILK